MGIEIRNRTQLLLIFDDGMDTEGKFVFKRKAFNQVKTDATPTQLFAIANALSPLQTLPLHSVERNDSSFIVSA